jgi:uncharacterized membrane protein YdjX (TVP38/TMEM64 family)
MEHGIPPREATASRTQRFLAVALGIVWSTLPGVVGIMLLVQLQPVSETLRGRGPEGVALFMLLAALCSGVGILPTFSQAILGGWVFGFAWGAPAALAGFAGGAIVGRAISLMVAGSAIAQMIDAKPRARVIRDALVNADQRKTLLYVILLRLPPNSPFAFMNLALTGSGVRMVPYVIGTVVGLAPRTLVAAWFAAAAASTGAEDLVAFAKGQGPIALLSGLALLALALGVLGYASKAALRRAGLAS